MLASLGTQTDKCIGRVASGMLAWKSSLAITEMQKLHFYCLGVKPGRTQLHRSPKQLRVVPLVGIPTEIKVAPVQTFASLIALAFTLDRNIPKHIPQDVQKEQFSISGRTTCAYRCASIQAVRSRICADIKRLKCSAGGNLRAHKRPT